MSRISSLREFSTKLINNPITWQFKKFYPTNPKACNFDALEVVASAQHIEFLRTKLFLQSIFCIDARSNRIFFLITTAHLYLSIKIRRKFRSPCMTVARLEGSLKKKKKWFRWKRERTSFIHFQQPICVEDRDSNLSVALLFSNPTFYPHKNYKKKVKRLLIFLILYSYIPSMLSKFAIVR